MKSLGLLGAITDTEIEGNIYKCGTTLFHALSIQNVRFYEYFGCDPEVELTPDSLSVIRIHAD